MKRSILIFVIILNCGQLLPQDFNAVLNSGSNNFYELRSAFQKDTLYRKTLSNHDLKAFARWEWYCRTRVDETGSMQKFCKNLMNYGTTLKQNTSEISSKSGIQFQMECLGPTTIDNWMGRGLTTSIWVDPSNFDNILIGTNNGGMWKSQNGGDNWICITDNSGYNIGGIADFWVNPENHNDILILSRTFIATSHMYLSGRTNLGVYRSSDGGSTWNSLPFPSLPMNDVFVKIIQIPDYDNGFFVLTTRSLYRTANDGYAWDLINITPPDIRNGFQDILFANNTLVVSGHNFLKKSDILGGVWSDIRNPNDGIEWDNANIDLAYDSILNRLYAFYVNITSELEKVEYTSNLENWNTFVDSTHLSATHYVQICDIGYNGDIFAGGVGLYQSQSSGANFINIRKYPLHVDIRDIYFPDPNNSNHLHVACDGGVAKTTDGGNTWIEINGDLVVNDFYSIAITPQDPEFMIGGLHDNHSYLRYPNGIWHEFGAGDGSTCLIDPNDINTYFYCNSSALMRKNISSTITSYIAESWPAIDIPVEMDPVDPTILYLGDGGTLYKSTQQGDAGSWIPQNSSYQKVINIAVAESNPNIVYYSSLYYEEWDPGDPDPDPGIWKYNGISWSEINIPSIPSVPITDIDVESADEDNIWISVGGYDTNCKVYRSIDGGISWSNHTEVGLPNLPVQQLAFDEKNQVLFAGTDVGLFWKHFYAYEWEVVPNFPKTIVSDLVINSLTNELVIATFGRGIWRINLDETFCHSLTIDGIETWNNDDQLCSDLIIASGGVLTVKSVIEMTSFNSLIKVQDSGELIVDGGTLKNGTVLIEDGGKLNIKNGGKIQISQYDNFSMEVGSVFEMTSGSIEIIE